MLRGVFSVTSGYTGGTAPRPSYGDVTTGQTGHAEAIRVEYDPGIIKLEELLAVFFSSHDPTSLNRQGNDVGTQYRSAIFYTSPEQKQQAEHFMQILTTDHVFAKPIVTELQALDHFYPAEAYHQNYYRQNQDQPYCQFVVDPKITHLRQKFAHLLKPTV